MATLAGISDIPSSQQRALDPLPADLSPGKRPAKTVRSEPVEGSCDGEGSTPIPARADAPLASKRTDLCGAPERAGEPHSLVTAFNAIPTRMAERLCWAWR